jgi:hypothetical protein
MKHRSSIDRREFLRRTGLAGAVLCDAARTNAQVHTGQAVYLVLNSSDPVASAAPAQWAARELELALIEHGATVHRCERPEQAPVGAFCVIASGSQPGI